MDLVPNALVIKVWHFHLRGAEQAGEFSPSRDIVLLDAFPRDESQAKLLEPQVDMQLVIYLRAADEEALKERVRRRNQRPDDQSDQVIEHRLAVPRNPALWGGA